MHEQGGHKMLPPHANPRDLGSAKARPHLPNSMASTMEVEAQRRKL